MFTTGEAVVAERALALWNAAAQSSAMNTLFIEARESSSGSLTLYKAFRKGHNISILRALTSHSPQRWSAVRRDAPAAWHLLQWARVDRCSAVESGAARMASYKITPVVSIFNLARVPVSFLAFVFILRYDNSQK